MSNQTLAAFVNKVSTIIKHDKKHHYIVNVDGVDLQQQPKKLMPHNGFKARLQKMTENGVENVCEVKPFYYISTLSGHDWQAKRDFLINALKARGVLIGA